MSAGERPGGEKPGILKDTGEQRAGRGYHRQSGACRLKGIQG